ncbi:PiggyBac transposable element-derived protein 4-like, partial [Elysia marginata]
LLNRSTYSCSTVRSNRRHWPQDLKGNLDPGECKMRQVGNLVACFWRDKHAICTLSTNVSPRLETADRRSKEGVIQKQIPTPILVYNNNMAG